MTKVLDIIKSAVQILIKDGYCQSIDDLTYEEVITLWSIRQRRIIKVKEMSKKRIIHRMSNNFKSDEYIDLSQMKPYVGSDSKIHHGIMCDSCKIFGFAKTRYYSFNHKKDFCQQCFDKIKDDKEYIGDSFLEFAP